MPRTANDSQRLSKQERTYTTLRERILDGTYGPGHRLVIDAIARELEVSPMPVREAIRRLEAEGWVIYRANQGAQVAPVAESLWAEVMATLAVLEGYATALAAPRLSAQDLKQMRKLNTEMSEALEELDLPQVAARNQAFHAVIHARCPNEHLRRLIEATLERLNTFRNTIFIYIPARGRVSIGEHEQLLELIESAADPARIESFAREHKLHTIKAYEQRLAEAGVALDRAGPEGYCGARRVP
jgi:DNA-binding GntR family transcriptional regulator